MTDELASWADRLEHAIAAHQTGSFDRVYVLRQTASTQDAALRLACGRPGAVVVAGRQTAGRGRLGRPWLDPSSAGLALTFVVEARRYSAAHLSLAGGVAAAEAIEQSLPPHCCAVGIRWPNDVVEALVLPDGRCGPGRKLAGVLLETAGALALMGIGINVLQETGDWPAQLAGRAASLRELGSSAARLDVAERLLIALDRALESTPEALCHAWGKRNVLLGRHAAFTCNGLSVQGTVQSLTPDLEIVLQASDGRTVRLPAAQASMVHGA
jgi:BirA family transcriptional regulator, biotin operon repressor / biotin---[acetyl-CoA-carboxylase] ligase